MSDHMSMGDWLEKFDTTERLSKGDVVEGTVISSNADEVMVNINFMADGVVPKTELPDENPLDYTPGQKVSVYVIKVDDGDGNVLLSLNKAEALLVWDMLGEMHQNQKSFELKIKEAVKGGVVGVYKTARVFIPASQLSLSFVENLDTYVGTKLKVQLIEFQPDTKKAVASHKVILKRDAESKRADRLSRISIGDALSGTVVRLADYGAFVDLGGVDGLIHVSQMSWKRVKHPSEVLKEGDVVDVIVMNVDREKEKISLKLAEVQENPWENIYMTHHINDIVTGKVTRLTQFGAFVELTEGIEGLIHISELSDQHVAQASEIVKVGDTVEVMILDIDAEQHRMALSLKAVDTLDEEEYLEMTEEEPDQTTTLSDLFGDKLKNLKLK
ncbi:MAG: 30S ribosomal protein S1 [Bacillota bacterium]|nr:30S ribosomal protein S1 [Bacillota bacterium]